MLQTIQESSDPALQDEAIFVGNGDTKKDLRSLEKFRNSGNFDSEFPEFRIKTFQGLRVANACAQIIL